MTNPYSTYIAKICYSRKAGLLHQCLMILAFMAIVSSCSDDESAYNGKSEGNGSDVISFSVKTSDVWNTATRSGYSSVGGTRLETLELSSPEAGKNLYLIPDIYDGINLGNSKEAVTRSSLTTTDNISDFGVFASLRPDGSSASSDSYSPDYMYNVDVTKANSWAPEDEYLWPGKATLHINAYSPYCEADEIGDEGITSIPASDDKGDLSISWVTPSDVANQIDLMWATPVDASSSPCDLTFNHALTAIKFVTGAEMAPCTIKEIGITDVVSSGSLNLETGAWTLGDTTADYLLSPQTVLSAEQGSQYVASGTAITADEQTLLLLPQTLQSSSAISLTITVDGTDYSFTSSLSGQEWTAGKTIIYRLSANPVTDSLILDIVDADGNPISTLKSSYTGGDLNYSIKSYYKSSDSEEPKQIPWKAEFIDDEGNVIDRPEWITSFTTEGDGDATCVAPTDTQIPTFSSISADTQSLRSAANVNTTSGNNPYNLSNSTGAANVENTANTYIVSAPGTYSIPLVYGNAIKGGSTNQAAYIWNTSTRNVLKHFLNHLGNEISDPYIYNNANCDPADAYIVWEGRIGTIKNLTLSADKHSIEFYVSPDFIRQGNAVLAVRDKSGNIMWSWQIWFTPHQPETEMQAFTYNNATYHIMARNIGQTTGGDTADFAAQTVKVRFTQITDDGEDPKSVILTIEREAYQEITSFHYSYYQWGRKDPFNSGVNIWYHADKSIVTTNPTSDYLTRPLDVPYVALTIQKPEIFWTASHSNEPTFDYVNLWNVKSTDHNGVKSIYDPSPVGFKVPGLQMKAFDTKDGKGVHYEAEVVNKFVEYPSVQYTLPGGVLDFTLFGYLSSDYGKENYTDIIGPVWMNNSNPTEASDFPFDNKLSYINNYYSRAIGLGVRPIKDE